MPPKIEKRSNVVVLDSSDDEDDGVRVKAPSNQNMPPPPQSSTTVTPSIPPNETLESRSFWKAGAYAVGPTSRTLPAHGSLEHARVHPKFLHSNATSHKWAFGAIAELLDNAVDEMQNGATFVKVDKIDIMKDLSPALLFQDDGGGMDPEGIRKCMSLGYSSKKANTTIGQYGNGFKTSTMRLGADAIVFSRATHASKATQSVGLLSYTFLRRTGQDDVIVPLIDFDVSGHWAEPIIHSSQEDWSSNLKTILEWSPFASKEELMQQFEDIGRHGTKVIIYNLWLNDEGVYELSFDDDDEDIRLRDEANRGGTTKLQKKTAELQSHISYSLRYSLRAYASILYLRKFNNFTILLRGKPLQQFNIADELKHSKVVTYKPQLAMEKEVIVETTVGFIKEAPALRVCGFNVYHKNRLIRPFWKVTPDGSSKGLGVVGVLEANFIEPAHDKQDFERSLLFLRLESRLKQIVNDYWKSHCHYVGYRPLCSSTRDMLKVAPVQTPVQHAVDQPIGLSAQGSSDEIVFEDVAVSISVDQICEENIQLFMRCEEHIQKEGELKEMIRNLEEELAEAKRKSTRLSVLLETKKKLRTLKQQTQKIS
ncbi:HATPase_c_3 domain-containing protein [Cephalotus follicularis]|uniref:HATPase_c_3 domain-containing protein n=1 Tax=Cephalotus follicularis TaxID=3775 RepID=A0A1Q3BW36_CEPFO|nr:HATPase_c_3 domain-containing protein [Cephalotus follicularis]